MPLISDAKGDLAACIDSVLVSPEKEGSCLTRDPLHLSRDPRDRLTNVGLDVGNRVSGDLGYLIEGEAFLLQPLP